MNSCSRENPLLRGPRGGSGEARRTVGVIEPVIALRYTKGNKRSFMVGAGWRRCRREKCALEGGGEGEKEDKESA